MSHVTRGYGLLTEVWRSRRSGAVSTGVGTSAERSFAVARGGLVVPAEAKALYLALRAGPGSLSLGQPTGEGDRGALANAIVQLAKDLPLHALGQIPSQAVLVPRASASQRAVDLPRRVQDLLVQQRLVDAVLRDGRASRAELFALRDMGLISMVSAEEAYRAAAG